MGTFKAKNPLYPLLGVLSGIVVLVFGLITAKSAASTIYLCGVWLLFAVFGYYKSCLAVLPFALIMGGIFCGITYALSKDAVTTYAAANRIFAVCIAVIPGLALEPITLVRNFSCLRAPRTVTLGMMIALGFFPLLRNETKRIREAMLTRGAGNVFNPAIFHRAFLIPLVVRLVNVSDTLALSVETRGFDPHDKNYTVYRKVRFGLKDALFAFVLLAGSVTAVAV